MCVLAWLVFCLLCVFVCKAYLLLIWQSHKKVGAMWTDAGLSWKDFLPEDKDINKFVTEKVMAIQQSVSLPQHFIQKCLSSCGLTYGPSGPYCWYVYSSPPWFFYLILCVGVCRKWSTLWARSAWKATVAEELWVQRRSPNSLTSCCRTRRTLSKYTTGWRCVCLINV